jgi:hypothetical protein
MPDNYRHTLPDWSGAATELAAPLQDISELAPRLGSPNAFRRQGRVFYQDEMIYQTYQVSSVTAMVATIRPHSGQSHLITKLAPGQSWGKSFKYLPVLPGRVLGLEVVIANVEVLPVKLYAAGAGLTLFRYDLITYEAAVRLNYYLENIQVLNDAGAWVEIGAISGLGVPSYGYTNLKFVCDFEVQEYKRVYFNELLFDDLNINFRSIAAGGHALEVNMQVWDSDINQKSASFDNLILTVDEASP